MTLGQPEGKSAVQSTQNWVNVLMSVGAGLLYGKWPALQQFAAAHPDVAAASTALIISGVNVLWRTFITKKPVTSILPQ